MARENRPAKQVYRGIWAILARFFKVPERPPSLLAVGGEQIDSFRPSPGFLGYLRFQFWLFASFIGAGLLVLSAVMLVNNPLVAVLLAPVLFIAVVMALVFAYVALSLRYDTTWYVMSDRSIRIRRGIWTMRETTITFENVQNVEFKQGPLQRHFGIADLIVQTAGGGGGSPAEGKHAPPPMGLIEGLDGAERIRDAIMTRVRQSRRSGLGDERPGENRPPGPGARWTPEHLEVLRDIRSGIAALRRPA